MDIVSEEWRPVVGYEGVYSVSNLGHVRRDLDGAGNTKAGRILATHPNHKNYLCVILSHAGRRSRTVHALVAEAFLGPRPENLPQIDHVNTNKRDNRPENLEYVTQAENMRRAVEHGLFPDRRGSRNAAATLTESGVVALIAEFLASDESVTQFARSKNLSMMLVRRILLRQSWANVQCDEATLAKAVAERKGRGRNDWQRKLSDEDIAAIRAEYVPRKTPLRVLAEKYGVRLGTVHNIVKRKDCYADK